MKDLGPASDFLALSINRDRSRRLLWIHQQDYIKGFLEFFQMDKAKANTRTPMEPGLSLQKFEGECTAEHRRWYQAVIGSIMWSMTGTRPDTAFAVIKLAKYNQNPGPDHFKAARHLMRYLLATWDYALVYDGNTSDQIMGMSDADWGMDKDERKSTSGNVFFLANSAITWKSKMQSTVATSTAESEYMALAEASMQSSWLRNLTWEIGQRLDDEPTYLFTDNQAAQYLVEEPKHDPKTRHIDIKYHFIRDLVIKGKVTVHWIPTDEMIADDLTKPLQPITHEKFREAMGIIPVSVI